MMLCKKLGTTLRILMMNFQHFATVTVKKNQFADNLSELPGFFNHQNLIGESSPLSVFKTGLTQIIKSSQSSSIGL